MRPYQSAVVPHIAGQSLNLLAELLAATADASAMITRFDAVLGSEIAPFATILLRSEAAASSQIENLSSGAKQIALAELGSREKRNASEIVGNVAAMTAALSLADDLNTDAVLAMHRALMESHAPDIAGQWRSEPVWIGGSAVGPHGADYIAPQAQYVPELMHDALAFAQRRESMHAQRPSRSTSPPPTRAEHSAPWSTRESSASSPASPATGCGAPPTSPAPWTTAPHVPGAVRARLSRPKVRET